MMTVCLLADLLSPLAFLVVLDGLPLGFDADFATHVESVASAVQGFQRVGHGVPRQHPGAPQQLHLQGH